MHSGWLVEIASMWGYHGASIVSANKALTRDAVNDYWMKNRIRFDSWNFALTKSKAQLSSPSTGIRVRAWQRIRSLVEEVLLAEPLTRVCVAVATPLENSCADSDSRAILHNVFQSHQEVRTRCLELILDGIDRGIEEARELNRLRHYLEHWTDLLIGYFADESTGAQYAFSVDRMQEFAEDYSYRMLGNDSHVVWSLLMASNRNWLDKHCTLPPMHPRANSAICKAALGMLNPDWFDSVGYWRTKTAQNIEQALTQADETVARLADGSWELSSHVVSSVLYRKKTVRI